MKKDFVDALLLILEDCMAVFQRNVHQLSSPYYYSDSDEMASHRAIQASKLTSKCIDMSLRILNERFSAVAKDWPSVFHVYQSNKDKIQNLVENAFDHLKEIRRKKQLSGNINKGRATLTLLGSHAS